VWDGSVNIYGSIRMYALYQDINDNGVTHQACVNNDLAFYDIIFADANIGSYGGIFAGI